MKEKNELLKYVEFLESQVDEQSQQIEILKSRQSRRTNIETNFDKELEVVEEDREDDYGEYDSY